MPQFSKSLKAWNSSALNETLINEIQQMDISQLPLQQALSQSSHVSDSKVSAVIINTSEDAANITVKAGVFFFGIIAGSCCSDDPTPVDEVQEYCELEFLIDKESGEVNVRLLD